MNILTDDIMNADPDSKTYKIVTYIKTLPQPAQNLIYLYAMHGSYTKVANQLKMPVSTVYKRIRAIIKDIQHNLQM